MKFRKVAVLTLIGAMAMSMTAFADSDLSKISGDISCTGSSALQPLVQAAADKFADVAPGVNITVDAGGSGQGLQNVSDGTSTVGDSDVFAEEKLDKDKAAELVDHQVCAIGMAVVVSQDVADGGVKSLTTDQLVSIFTGETTNWKDVGSFAQRDPEPAQPSTSMRSAEQRKPVRRWRTTTPRSSRKRFRTRMALSDTWLFPISFRTMRRKQ